MDFLFPIINPLRLLISSFSLFFSPFLFPLMLSFSFLFLLPFLFQVWLYERLRLLHPLAFPPSQYLPKNYRDRRPKHTEMSFDEFTKFMKRINVTDIQWIVEWWCISSMVKRSFKDNCVPWVGLRCFFYYSTCRIARQFGDRQGAPSDDGSFHTLVFTDRILDRIHESWPGWRVTKGICFP